MYVIVGLVVFVGCVWWLGAAMAKSARDNRDVKHSDSTIDRGEKGFGAGNENRDDPQPLQPAENLG